MINKILIVEDESIIAFDLKKILESNDYECIVNIDTVEAAIACIEKENIALVLIDINLNNNKSGIDLGQYLLEKGNHIPHIYLTSYADGLTVDLAKQTRPQSYIVKPYKPQELLINVSIVLNNYKHKKIAFKPDNVTIHSIIPFKIKETVNFINDNLDKRITVEDLSDMTPWNKTHFSRIFKKYLHKNPYQYILEQKIDKAKLLLQCSKIRLDDLAFELGFNSYSNFYQAFKKVSNETPENYCNRKKIS
jgi:YesN/AraC family two-component response regulator